MNNERGFMKTVKNKYGEFVIYRRSETFVEGFGKTIANLSYERPVVDILEKAKYDTFIDVGANFGYHSVIAANYCGKVFGFEPHPLRYGFYLWNVKDFKNIYPEYAYIGTGTAYVIGAFNGMVGNKREQRTHSFEVMKYKLDDVVKNSDGKVFIKIDTEGNDLEVLESGSDALKSENTEWVVEYHSWVDYPLNSILNKFEGYHSKQIMNRFPENKTVLYHFWR